MSESGFRRTSGIKEISVTGYLMPALENRQPVLCGMPGTDDLFVLLFSDKVKLDAFIAEYLIHYDRIQQVTDGGDFVDSIQEENARGGRPYELRIAVDPYKHENGNMRWTEIFNGD